MKTRTLKQLVLYNYRYFFGYTIIAGFIGYFLLWQLATLVPGLADVELVTAARHTSLSELLLLPLYPLHGLIQWASMQLLGISTWAIRIPGVLLAGLSAFFIYNLLKKWFGKSTALLATAILLSADWFLFIARLGTGAIEFSLWLSIALFSFTKLIERKDSWLPALAVSLVGLLFAPFGPYAAVTLLVALFSCRVFRGRFMDATIRMRLVFYAILLVGFILGIIASVQNVEFIKNVLGVQSSISPTSYVANVFTNLSSPVAVLPTNNPVIGPSGLLFVRFFELIFILFGVAMFWKTRVNRLNLVVLVLSVVVALASGFSDGSRGMGVMIVPAVIYMTAGIRHLMHRWKRTFPKNPYARVGSSVPLALLFACVVFGHYLSYFVIWPSQTVTQESFRRDFKLAQTELNRSEYSSKSCLVETSDKSLQKLLLASNTNCAVLFPDDSDATNAADVLLLKPTANGTVFTTPEQKTRALVSETTQNSARWVVVTSDL